MELSVNSPFFIFNAILLALILVLLCSWLSIQVAIRLQLIDVPNSAPHKRHSQPTPLAGGMALMLTLLISEILLGGFGDGKAMDTMRGIFLPASLIFAIGLWDDYKSLPPSVKFAGQFLSVLILIRLGIMVQIFESPAFFLRFNSAINYQLDWWITVLWVVGITNAFNFVDSMDGLAVGLGGTAAAFFMIATQAAEQPMLCLLSALILGASIGLYFFNSPPALLFLGDAGAQTLGFILAVLAIAYRPIGNEQSSSWLVPILVLGVPIFDATLVVLSRIRRRQPVYSASQDHTYHRLICFGLAPARAVLVMQVASLGLGCLAFTILPQPPLIANLIFGCTLFLGLTIVALLDRREDWRDRYRFTDQTADPMNRRSG